MQLAHYLGLLHAAEQRLADAFREVGDAHRDEVDVVHLCHRLAEQCDAHAERLAAVRRALRRSRPTTNPSGCTPRSSRAAAAARSRCCATSRTST